MVIYALLVGIDDYPLPVPKLRGCVNDVEQMQEYLVARVDPGGQPLGEVLKIKKLTNREATRQAVIRTFREHLGQAGPDDVALFCYSGLTSREHSKRGCLSSVFGRLIPEIRKNSIRPPQIGARHSPLNVIR
jgi:hypothetical protein